MPFLLMVFLTLACLPEPEVWWPPLIPSPLAGHPVVWSALLTTFTQCVSLVYAARVSRRLAQTLQTNPLVRDQLLSRYERARFLHQVLLYGGYILVMCVGGWGWSVHEFWSLARFGVLPGAELIVLLPLLLPMLLSWVIFYDAENALHHSAQHILGRDAIDAAFESEAEFARRKRGRSPDKHFFGGRWSYVLFQSRQKLALVCVPILLLLAQKELQRLLVKIDLPAAVVFWLHVAGFAIIPMIFLLMPLVVRLVLGLKPLPAGPLRDQLERASQRLRFRCTDILVWNTHHGVANALVVGVLPWPRFVVFTDRLLADFGPDEVEAVFGHEVGHVKHYHMLYYFLFLSGSMMVLGLLAHQCIVTFIGDLSTNLEMLPLGVLALLYIFFVFGFISRRCERQADIYGCRTVSCDDPNCAEHGVGATLAPQGRGLCPTGIRTFVRALERVADLNGINRDRPSVFQSWLHSTIGRRIAFLQSMIADPAVEPAFQRRVALVKWGLVVVLGGLLVAVLITGTYTYANF